MKIIISQQNKKILITFESGKLVDNYAIDKAEDFLAVIDKFLRKRRIKLTTLSPFGRSPVGGQKADLKFIDTGMLTERVVRSIMKGLSL